LHGWERKGEDKKWNRGKERGKMENGKRGGDEKIMYGLPLRKKETKGKR